MSMSKKIKHLLIEKNVTITQLAKLLDTTPQNLTNKLSRDNFKEKNLQQIADVLNCKFEAKFIIEDEQSHKIKEI